MSNSGIEVFIDLEFEDFQDSASQKQKEFYKPGDFMEGVVVVELPHPLKVTGLDLHVSGHAHTAWEVGGKKKKKSYEDQEIHLDHWETMMQMPKNGHQFPKGRHRFAFRFQLPKNLPSSFSGPYGGVTYVAQAILQAGDELLNTICSIPFLVLRREPLPSEAYEKVKMNKSKNFFIPPGSIEVNATLEHGIAVPGEAILVNAVVNNWSGRDITLLQGSIIMESTYYARGEQVSFRQVLNKRQDFYDVNLRWGRKWTDVKIQVPPYLPDSGLEMCNIIEIKYIFQYRVQIDGHDDLVVERPLYVGYHQDPDFILDPKDMLMNRMLLDTSRSSIQDNGFPLPAQNGYRHPAIQNGYRNYNGFDDLKPDYFV